MNKSYDFVVVGAGIVGLCIARSLRRHYPHASIAIIEKEKRYGVHTSGRNSGVIHRGVYYPANSLKAKFCVSGAKAMVEFCDENNIPVLKCGKIILPNSEKDDSQIDFLFQRAKANGATIEIIDQQQIGELEPLAKSVSGRALFSPLSSVVDPNQILFTLAKQLEAQNVSTLYDSEMQSADMSQNVIQLKNGSKLSFGHLINSAGLHADVIARACGLTHDYTMIPFRGGYYEVKSHRPVKMLLYPVPDLNVPFLGVHFTPSLSGRVYLGPTAFPALGRENYSGLSKASLPSTIQSGLCLSSLFVRNTNGFRNYVFAELRRLIRARLLYEARQMVPTLTTAEIHVSPKRGLRAQLYSRSKRDLLVDFQVETRDNSTHVLNVVSPGFTSAMSFAEHIVQNHLGVKEIGVTHGSKR